MNPAAKTFYSSAADLAFLCRRPAVKWQHPFPPALQPCSFYKKSYCGCSKTYVSYFQCLPLHIENTLLPLGTVEGGVVHLRASNSESMKK